CSSPSRLREDLGCASRDENTRLSTLSFLTIMKYTFLLIALLANTGSFAQWKNTYIDNEINSFAQYDTMFFVSIKPSKIIGAGAGVYKYTPWRDSCGNCAWYGKWSGQSNGIPVKSEDVGMFASQGRYFYYYHFYG